MTLLATGERNGKVDGYPAGEMLEIALRRTQDDKLEMFKWRSEFIALLGAQPGPLVEREWKSLSAWPALTGAGTWTGTTWWENQQAWHDMANMIFPSPVTSNWLSTINMTLCHVRPNDDDFDLRTLAQSGKEVLELGILAYLTDEAEAFDDALDTYLATLNDEPGVAAAYTFDFLNNGMGFPGPFTTYYLANGMPNDDGSEMWKVYMAVWESEASYTNATMDGAVAVALDALKNATIKENSSIDVAARSTSRVCCKADMGCNLDPEECNVSVLGFGDTWAPNCAQCPKPCVTDYGVCSLLASQTCYDIGGTVVDSCEEPATEVVERSEDHDGVRRRLRV